MGQVTIGERVERLQVGFDRSLNGIEFRLQRAVDDLSDTAELDDEKKQALRPKTAEFVEVKRSMVEALIREAKADFDQTQPGNRPLGGPFKAMSDLHLARNIYVDWLRHVSSVLTDAQVKSYEKVLRDRDAFHLKAKVLQWVADIDNRVFLSQHQRVDLLQTLSEWYSLATKSPNPPRDLRLRGASRPKFPVEVLSRVLDEQQLQEWSNNRR